MNQQLEQIKALQDLNITALRGMLKILKPIKAEEASAVRLMLAQILQNDMEAERIVSNLIKPTTRSDVDWEAVTEDIE